MGVIILTKFELNPKTKYVLSKIKGKKYKDEIEYIVDLRAIEEFILRSPKSFAEWLGYTALIWTYEDEFKHICNELDKNAINNKAPELIPILQESVKYHKNNRGTAARFISRNVLSRWKEKKEWLNLGGVTK